MVDFILIITGIIMILSIVEQASITDTIGILLIIHTILIHLITTIITIVITLMDTTITTITHQLTPITIIIITTQQVIEAPYPHILVEEE